MGLELRPSVQGLAALLTVVIKIPNSQQHASTSSLGKRSFPARWVSTRPHTGLTYCPRILALGEWDPAECGVCSPWSFSSLLLEQDHVDPWTSTGPALTGGFARTSGWAQLGSPWQCVLSSSPRCFPRKERSSRGLPLPCSFMPLLLARLGKQEV